MKSVDACRVAGAFGWLVACQMSWAAPAIYTCTDANGKRLTSDRPIAACLDREQRVLNSDGSIRHTIARTLTAEERAEKEARERQIALKQAAQADAVRRDRNLMSRFADEAAHNKAREAALEDLRNAMLRSEERLARLAVERKPLIDETEFYVGKPLPAKLKRQLDANDATTEAQRTLVRDQRYEIDRINAIYDVELEHLKKLWAGATPGSLDLSPGAATASSSAMRKASSAN